MRAHAALARLFHGVLYVVFAASTNDDRVGAPRARMNEIIDAPFSPRHRTFDDRIEATRAFVDNVLLPTLLADTWQVGDYKTPLELAHKFDEFDWTGGISLLQARRAETDAADCKSYQTSRMLAWWIEFVARACGRRREIRCESCIILAKYSQGPVLSGGRIDQGRRVHASRSKIDAVSIPELDVSWQHPFPAIRLVEEGRASFIIPFSTCTCLTSRACRSHRVPRPCTTSARPMRPTSARGCRGMPSTFSSSATQTTRRRAS